MSNSLTFSKNVAETHFGETFFDRDDERSLDDLGHTVGAKIEKFYPRSLMVVGWRTREISNKWRVARSCLSDQMAKKR